MSLQFWDITLPLHPGLISFPGDPPYRTAQAKSIAAGDGCNLSDLGLGSHTGTHMDAPRHFYSGGRTVDQLELEHFIGPARVLAIDASKAIRSQDLKDFAIERGEILLLKTSNSRLWSRHEFDPDFVYLSSEAARYLADIGIRTLGFDYLSIEEFENDQAPAHHILLERGIVILEGLDLRQVEPGTYRIAAQPLKLVDGDGSPVRAVLYRE